MAGGSGALGFGSGLAKGLAAGFLRSHQEKRVAEEKKADQERQNHLAMLEFSLKHGSDTGDYSATQQILETLDPDLGKQFKKQGGSPFEHLAPILAAGGQQAAAPNPQGPDAADLPSRQPVGVFVPEPAQWSFGGTPLESEGARKERDFNATIGARRKAGSAQGLTGEELARYALVGQMPVERLGASAFQSIVGEMPDGSPAFGILDRAKGVYIDPETREPLIGFQPRTTTASASLGQYAERAAGELGYKTANAARQAGPEAMAAVNKRAEELRAKEAGSSTTARVEAQQATEFLTPAQAAEMQTTYGITKAEAAQLSRVPLTPPQIQAAGASFAFDRDLQRAKVLFEKVWPKTEQPERRRIALMALQRSQNPEFAELLGLLNRMPQRLAVMEQGSRPSDIDVAQFKTTLPSTAASDWSLVTVPTTYEAGLALLSAAENITKSARESIGIVPPAERQRGGAASQPKTASPAAPSAGKPYQDASGNWIIP